MEQIYKLIPTKYSQFNILGVIFDSAPGYMHPGLGPRVIAAEQPPSLKRTAMVISLNAAFALTPLLYGDRPKLYWNAMREFNVGPALYLYSDDDPLCDGRRLTELISDKRALGQDISAVRWE